MVVGIDTSCGRALDLSRRLVTLHSTSWKILHGFRYRQIEYTGRTVAGRDAAAAARNRWPETKRAAATVTVIGKAGQGKADLRVMGGDGSLSASNANGIPVVIVSAGPVTGHIALMNEKEEFPIVIHADADGGLIEVFDTDGGVKGSLPL